MRVEIGKGRNRNKGSFETDYLEVEEYRISEYQLDDGQVKIRTAYRSIKEVEDGILALERMKHLYLNRLNGRITILRDEKSYRR